MVQAFPAQNPSDRTTYMFTYLDADPARPPLAALMELYWQTMPAYQVPGQRGGYAASCQLMFLSWQEESVGSEATS